MEKLFTLNTHSWIEDNPEDKLEKLIDFIIREEPNYFCLQEINQQITSPIVKPNQFYVEAQGNNFPIKEDNYALLIAEKLASKGLVYYWSWAVNHVGYGKYDEGVAIFSKEKLTDVESILVSQTDDYEDYHTRKVLVGNTSNKAIYSVHFSWWIDDKSEKCFEKEWNIILKNIKARRSLGYQTIIMGDFNNAAHIENEGYQLIKESAPFLKDTFVNSKSVVGQYTVLNEIDGWDGNDQSLRIDYVFVDEDVEVDKHMVIFDNLNEEIISDHFGIIIEL